MVNARAVLLCKCGMEVAVYVDMLYWDFGVGSAAGVANQNTSYANAHDVTSRDSTAGDHCP